MSTDDERDSLAEPIRRRRHRREQWLKERDRSFLANLSLIGAIGWSIIAPTLAGIFLGRWLDRRLDMGVFWSASLLAVGLALGCWMAWRRIGR
jgi:ATP synthase protein I